MVEMLESFSVRCERTRDYATFVALQRFDPARSGGYFMVAIDSSYGYGYSYAWSQPGGCFYDFLCTADEYYLCSKFCMGERGEVDWEETCARIKHEILQRRRDGSITAAEARDMWPESTFDSEVAFCFWEANQNSGERRIDAAYEHRAWKPGRRVQDFLALHKAFWPAFCEQLREAKRKREAARANLSALQARLEQTVAEVLAASSTELG